MRASWDVMAAVALALTLLSFPIPVPFPSTTDVAADAPVIVHPEWGDDSVVDSNAPEPQIVPVGVVSSTVVPVASTCAPAPSGTPASAPALTRADGAIVGTSSADLAEFATAFNAIRVAQCLPPIPVANFRYNACMEQRLIWMAEDPSTDPASAWGHMGSVRSDGVPSVDCDGNLAGGSDNTGATVAQKWWDSLSHRASLYRPDSTADVNAVCIDFAMTHGGIPNEPSAFTRAAARWTSC